MNLYSLPASIALAVNIALGLIIFFNNPQKLANRLFTLLVGSMVVWNVGIIIMSNSHSQLMALLGAKLILTGIFIFPEREFLYSLSFFCILHLSFPGKIEVK